MKQKLSVKTFIKAPKKKVWETMLSEATYGAWTKAFNPTSRFVGTWETGSKMLFLGFDEGMKGDMGMVSLIKEARPHDFVSIEHQGIIVNGVEDTTSEAAKKWAPALENYSFVEKDGGTELSIDMDIDGAEKEMMEKMWKDALVLLKDLAER